MSRAILPVLTLALVVGLRAAPIADASIVESYSSGSGIRSSLELVPGTVELIVGPLPVASGTGAPAYNTSDTVASVDLSETASVLGLVDVPVLNLSTSLIQCTATSNADGLPGARSTDASAMVNNLMFEVSAISPLAVVAPLVSLNATVIQSTSQVSGQSAAWSSMGTSMLAGTSGVGGNQASLVVAGVTFLLDANPTPNTTMTIDSSLIPGLVGSIDVFLNEQIGSGDGLTSRGLQTNALRLSFSNFGVGLGPTTELLNGDLVVGSSSAVQSVPEPASLGMLAVFLTSAGAWSRRRRRAEAA